MKSPFLGQSYVARSPNLAADRLVNLYPEMTNEGKDVGAFFGTPGLIQIFNVGDGPIRGILNYFNVTLFFVSGNTLYFTDSLSVTPAAIGTIAGTGRVSMCANLEQKVFIVAGTVAYTYNLATSTLTQETTLPPTGGSCDFIDAQFVFEEAGTAEFFLFDGTTFDPLDFAVAEGMPDHLVCVLADHSELWLFGGLHTEVWQDTGAADFPFQQMPGGLIPQGCVAQATPKRLDNSIFWLGRNEYGQGIVWRANGYTPARVSTYALEFALQGYGDISDAFAMTYQQEGHSFYVLTFPTAGKTWALDVSNGLWHERSSIDPNTQTDSRWRPNCLTFFQGEIVAGDSRSGRGFTLSLDCYTDGDYGAVTGFTPAMRSTSQTLNQQASCAIVDSSDTGYLRTQVLTASGGTFSRPAQFMVASNTSGGTVAVTALALIDAGDYTVLPDNPVALIGGTGGGLLADLYWTATDQIVTPVNTGSGYTPSAPTLSISGATATATSQLIATRIPGPFTGSGYVAGDLLTLSGGTGTIAAQVSVAAVDNTGHPLAYSLVEPGAYTSVPTGFITLTGGSGSGAETVGFWGLGIITLTSGGTEFVEAPDVVVSGSGEGAHVYAVVSSGTNYIKALRSWRALPQGQNNLKRTFQHALQLDMQSGVGLDGVQLGDDPSVSLRWSDDGGHTWSNYHNRKIGKIGASGTRVIFRRLGSTEKLRDRVYEASITDPVKRVLIGAELDLSAGWS